MAYPQFPRVGFPQSLKRAVAIANVNIIPMDTDAPEVIEAATVIIDGGLIQTIQPSEESLPENIQVIDGAGAYAIPGLADMHVHTWDPSDAALYLSNGIITVRNMWGSSLHLAYQKAVENRDIPGPRVITTSPIIDGVDESGSTVWSGSIPLTDSDEADELVSRLASRGYRQIKAYSRLSLPVLEALGTACRRYGIPLVGHCPDGVTFEQAMATGMSCFEHLLRIDNGRLTRTHGTQAEADNLACLDWQSVETLARRMAREQVWNCPTLVVVGNRMREADQALDDPYLEYMRPRTVELWKRQAESRSGDWRAGQRKRLRNLRSIVKVLHESGAPILAGTDSGNPFVVPGFFLVQELKSLEDSGLSRYESLRCATVNAARFMGESEVWGAITPGMRADIVLLSDNPLDDLEAVSKVRAVFVNSFYLSRRDLDHLLSDRLESISPPPGRVAVDIPGRHAGGQTVAEGKLAETIEGVRSGTLSYRHSRRGDNLWQVQEDYIGQGSRLGWHYRRTISLLDDDFRLHSVVVQIRTQVGVAGINIDRSDGDSYRIRTVDLDGFRDETRYPSDLVYPSDVLLMTMPALIGRVEFSETQARAISATHSSAQPELGTVAFEPTAQRPNAVRFKEVRYEFPGRRSVFVCSLGVDGSLVGIHEPHNIAGDREFKSVED